ncbi:HAMP domain-containing histidine kinase [Paenibacillus mesophilus]|uniref:HAMP domain-containing sensor histidine kinase n=1 Tax=Paenibacillus mesophilus TaxID=2582849 RepID=UPI00110EC547|nr:HAMP domain-containing sensor histidine kinase [Paenibacillus mesophilus]TMV48672.1 HAMP domain-containing histidine kinase [Paenibacillus mesophilus]
MSNRKRKSLLYSWSVRYFLVVLLSMIVIGTATLFMIQRNNATMQYKAIERMARDIAEEAIKHGGRLPEGEPLARFLNNRILEYGLGERPVMAILNVQGQVVQHHPPVLPQETVQLEARLNDIKSVRPRVFELEPLGNRMPYLTAVHPMTTSSGTIGYALYLSPKTNVLQGLLEFKLFRIAALIGFLLSGWYIVYWLTRRLVKPIREAVDAANQIVAGNYDLQFNMEQSEKEIHQLMHAFKEMADRLSRLEATRTQLLAGVTHELKTPVASISGLIQAVKDGVVSGKEAEKFLDNSLKQVDRLHHIIEDLLAFNSFAGNVAAVKAELVELEETVRDIVERWRHSRPFAGLEMVVEADRAVRNRQIWTDSARLEQILVNLLNNAQDATDSGGRIRVRLLTGGAEIHIQVEDTGCGIEPDEQLDVFEPFYRGKDKRKRVRGLGLGLPFSRMIARALGGELILTNSGPGGTTFTLTLPVKRPDAG